MGGYIGVGGFLGPGGGGGGRRGSASPAANGIPVDLLFDFEDGVAGDLITEAGLAAMLVGTPLTLVKGEAGDFAAMYHQALALPLPHEVKIGGVDYDGSGTLGLDVRNSPDLERIVTTFTATDTVAFCSWVKFTVPTPGENIALDHIQFFGEGGFGVMQQTVNTGGVSQVLAHGTDEDGASTFGNAFAIENAKQYFVSFYIGGGFVHLAVWDPVDWKLVGHSIAQGEVTAIASMTFQTGYLFNIAGTHIRYDNFAVAFGSNAVFPLGLVQSDLAAVASVAVAQTEESAIDISWGKAAGALLYNVQRSTEGGAWETVASDLGVLEYQDTGLTDTTSYRYRVIARLRSWSATATESADIVVDNSPFISGGCTVVADAFDVSVSTDVLLGIGYNTTNHAVRFTAGSNYTACKASAYLGPAGTPVGDLTAVIYSDGGGQPGTAISNTLTMNTTGIANGWFEFPAGFDVELVSGTVYWLVLRYVPDNSFTNYLHWFQGLVEGGGGAHVRYADGYDQLADISSSGNFVGMFRIYQES